MSSCIVLSHYVTDLEQHLDRFVLHSARKTKLARKRKVEAVTGHLLNIVQHEKCQADERGTPDEALAIAAIAASALTALATVAPEAALAKA